MSPPPTILCVDDEPNVLAGIERNLCLDFDVTCATGGQEALREMSEREFQVIVSDMRMPGMNGARLLEEVHRRHPSTSRILLTGHADMESAIAAVNRGQIFRFLTKPCGKADLRTAITAGVEQHRLVHAEKALLEHTLRGCVAALADTLSILAPDAHGQAAEVRRLATAMLEGRVSTTWYVDIAAVALQLARVTLEGPDGESPPDSAACAKVAARLIGHLPRLDPVVRTLRSPHVARVDATEEERLAGACLGTAFDWVRLRADRVGVDEALARMEGDPRHARAHLEWLRGHASHPSENERRMVAVSILQAQDQMELAADVVAKKGNAVLVTKGRTLTRPLIERLRVLDQRSGVAQPLFVWA